MRYASVRPRFEPFLLAVERPGRYLGLERNVTRKDLGAMSTSRCASRFPDAYEIGMSHTGTKILYEIVNRRPGWACERTYAPWVDFEAVLRREKVPLFSVESFAPVSDFDVVGFSLQSELNYTNVPNMLDLVGHPGPRGGPRRRGPDRHRRRARASRTPSRSRTSSTSS